MPLKPVVFSPWTVRMVSSLVSLLHPLVSRHFYFIYFIFRHLVVLFFFFFDCVVRHVGS